MPIERKFTSNKSNGNSDKKLRVMSFNVLAQGLSADSFVRCPLRALEFSYRYPRIVDELTAYSPDIICLQEVDMFPQLKSDLSQQGYQGFWQSKVFSPCLMQANNIGPDGSAIFFKTLKLECHKTRQGPMADWNQVLLSSLFSITGTNLLVLVVCLHLKSKETYASDRLGQGKFVLDFIAESLKQHPNISSIIIAGDLNSVPTESVHELIRSHDFMSSYRVATGSDPDFTTSKIRMKKEKEFLKCETEDYIYYKNVKDGGLAIDRVLLMPEEKELGEGKLPSLDYPSDHLSMVTDFSYTD